MVLLWCLVVSDTGNEEASGSIQCINKTNTAIYPGERLGCNEFGETIEQLLVYMNTNKHVTNRKFM